MILACRSIIPSKLGNTHSDLAVECAKAANRFPDVEQTALADQLRRACYSVPLNIAEGTSRKGTREYRKFLDTAWGSLAEVQSALAIARDVGYLEPAEFGRSKRSERRRARRCSACSGRSARQRIERNPVDCSPRRVFAPSLCVAYSRSLSS